jgi:hypothetical protein
MTPKIIKNYYDEPFIIELSEGTNISGNKIYGVTLIVEDIIKNTFRSDTKDKLGSTWFNNSFTDYSQALIHIDNIKKYIKDQQVKV